jgi:hypothetical protein
MAATACYFSVTSVPGDGGTVCETKAFSNVIASTYGTVTLQALGPDGSTWLTAATAFAANGTETADLCPGQYRVALA